MRQMSVIAVMLSFAVSSAEGLTTNLTATPETLSSVVRQVRVAAGDELKLALAPGTYELAKIFPTPSTVWAKKVRFGISSDRLSVIRICGSSDNPSETVLVGAEEDSDVRAFGALGAVTLSNLTFRNCRSSVEGAVFPRYGYYGHVRAENCVFEDCRSEVAGGVSTAGVFSNCVFRRCESAGRGGALTLGAGDRLDDCRFEGCRAGTDGGAVSIACSYTDSVSVASCAFIGNRAENGRGGGLFVQADPRGKCPVANCRFADNVAAYRSPASKRDLQFAWDSFPATDSAVTESGNVYSGSDRPVAGRTDGGPYRNRVTVRPGDDLCAVRDLLRREREPGARAEVVLEDGVYEVSCEIELTEADANVTWRARNPGGVTFVGGWNFRGRDMGPLTDATLLARLDSSVREKVRAIDVPERVRGKFAEGSLLGGCPALVGQFENYNGKRSNDLDWCPHYPSYPVFSVDRHYMRPAQWPNGNEYWVVREEDGTIVRPGSSSESAVIRVPDGRSERWNLDAGEICAAGFLRACVYSTERAAVPGRGEESGTIRIAQRELASWARVRFVNVLEELDVPGEWYYDRTSGKLILYPPALFAGDSLCAVGTMADSFFHVTGSDITLAGFNFTAKHSHPAVCVEGGERVWILGCKFSSLEYWACYFSGRHGGVRSCDFAELPADGLFLCGGNKSDFSHGDNVIENCHATDFGFLRDSWQRGGFYMTGCGNRLRHSQADNSPETGFEYDGVDQLVEYCRVYNVSYWNSDSGAVYTPGGIDRSYGNVFRYNDVSASPGGVNGLYCDDCSSGNVIYGNVVRNFGNAGIFIGGGRDNCVSNNLLISSAGYGLHLDLRGLAWADLKSAAATAACVETLRAQWDPETSPTVARYPQIAGWFDDPDRIRAPYDDCWRNNVVIDCNRAALVSTGAELVCPDFRLVSEGNLHVRTQGTQKPDLEWLLKGFTTVDLPAEELGTLGVDLLEPGTAFDGRQFLWKKGSLSLEPDSVIVRQMPEFKPIPFDEIGLYDDAWRKELKGGPVPRPSVEAHSVVYATSCPTYDPDTGREIATRTLTADGREVEAWSLTNCFARSENVILLKGVYDFSKKANPNASAATLFAVSGSGDTPRVFAGETCDFRDVELVGGGVEQNMRCFQFGRLTRLEGLTIRNFGITNSNGAAIHSALGRTGSTVSNCCFVGNVAVSAGAITGTATLSIYDCTFTSNKFSQLTTNVGMGAGAVGGPSSETGAPCTRCTFVGNGPIADYVTSNQARGGAVYNVCCTNCVFIGNSAFAGGAAAGERTKVPALTRCYRCAFTNNLVGGTYGIVEDVDCVGCDFYGNTAASGYVLHGIHARTVDNCRFVTNECVVLASLPDGIARNSLFLSNVYRGQMLTDQMNVLNCLFASNKAIRPKGESVYFLQASSSGSTIRNSVLVDNARLTSNAISILAGKFTYANCVVDVGTDKTGESWNIVKGDEISTCFAWNEDGAPTGIVSNVTSNELLIDKGCDVGWTATEFDLAGNPRVFNEIVDIGCYEFFKKKPGLTILLR